MKNRKETLAKVRAAHSFILQDIRAHHPVSEIAAHVNLNEFDLKREFKKKYKKGLFELLTDERLKQAKQLLKAGNELKQIAYQLGYSNVSALNHAFKRKFKITPTAYRNRL